MDWKIELLIIGVTDVDRAKAFYADTVGFNVDHDQTIPEQGVRFVQLTPPGSGCSIAFGEGITDMEPGTQKNAMIVVADIQAARDQLVSRGVAASEIADQGWGLFLSFADPDGNEWTLQQLPQRD